MISTVIVNWNSGGLLEDCISSLEKHAGNCEIIVVDNASEDSSADLPPGAARSSMILRNESNLGFAAAANQGWRWSRGRWILFLNPDVITLPGSVERLREVLAQDCGVWAAGGLLLNSSGRPQTGFNVRAFPTLSSVAAEALLLDEIWPGNPWTERYRLRKWQPAAAADACQPAAACLMVSRRALESLGGFDELFAPAWFEDVDLCRRIWDAGRRIRFEPAAPFRHKGGYSLAHLGQERFLLHYHTNEIRYFAKHHGMAAAEQVRKLVSTGMYLRAALCLIHLPAVFSSRSVAAQTFWRAGRHFSRMHEVLP